MTEAVELLERLQSFGVSITVDRDELVLRPASKVPPDLLDVVVQHKPEILAHLRREERVGDGQAPPLDRPPETEQELRRLVDYLADPEAFTRWLAWAMSYVDPAEETFIGEGMKPGDRRLNFGKPRPRLGGPTPTLKQ